MDFKDIVETVVTVVIAFGGWAFALVIALGNCAFAWLQGQANRKEKQREEESDRKRRRIEKVHAYLNAYGELVELYRLFARKESHLVRNENGEFITDASGSFVKEEHILEPEPRFELAIELLQGTDIRSAIAQKIVAIRLMNGEVGDIISELDPTGAMNSQLSVLHYKTTSAIEFWIKHKAFEEMATALKEATAVRREIRSNLEKIIE